MHFREFFHAFDIRLEKNEKWHGRSGENNVISCDLKKRKKALQKRCCIQTCFLLRNKEVTFAKIDSTLFSAIQYSSKTVPSHIKLVQSRMKTYSLHFLLTYIQLI